MVDAVIDRSKIKVVKRTDVKAVKQKKKKRTPAVAARTIVANVTDWVADLKEKKQSETKAALDVLFPAGPEPSNP